MYLVELDTVTGLVKVEGDQDGILAIPEFREVILDENLGIVCFTAIALTVDYLTPIRYYDEKDRPYKAMEIATHGNRRAFVWDQEKIQVALNKYDDLQYNPVIEEKRTLDFMRLDKLKEIRKIKEGIERYIKLEEVTMENIEDVFQNNLDVKKELGDLEWEHQTEKFKERFIKRVNQRVIKPYNSKMDEKNKAIQETKLQEAFKQLGLINELIDKFEKKNKDTDIFSDGPVRNGYKLTRLEEKQLDKNSFYHL